MIVVADATPLIGLAKAGRFYLLKEIFGKIYIPEGVYEEVVVEGRGRAGAREVNEATWIETVEVKDRLAVELLKDELDKGESESIVLAKELEANWVLMDERTARRKLEALGIDKIGTLGILLKAKEMGLLESIKPEMDKLRAKGFRIGRRVYEEVLKIAEEAKHVPPEQRVG